ncbi:alpha/beta fold hydrolase [Pontibacter sp. JAM-7]|uniref:alpha/beta fold hydrolase n=1 Tax=Pontibacter sp. JAM-7 TaxID=3366581 RepID=UPI003AF782D3
MQLNFQTQGEGPALIIMHGLFGSLGNWAGIARQLATEFHVISVDLRNHGRSPHDNLMNYSLMANDIVKLMNQLGLDKAHILGHSMGGKVAMELAMNHADYVNKLIVVDIAPVRYPRQHDNVFAGLRSLDLASLTSRTDADNQLAAEISEVSVRAFLLTNLYRTTRGGFGWRMNLEGLYQAYDEIADAPHGEPFAGQTLFIKGGNSDYLDEAYRPTVLSHFPQAKYQIMGKTGHWPHAEQPNEFCRLVKRFLME